MKKGNAGRGNGAVFMVPALVLLFAVFTLAQVPQQVHQVQDFATAGEASGTKTPQSSSAEHPEIPSAGSDFSFIRAAGGLGLVLSLIGLAYFGAKRFFPQYFVQTTADKTLRIVETLAIGEKRSIAVIEFDDQRFLVGNTSQQITLLATLPPRLSLTEEPQAASAPFPGHSKNKPSSASFRSIYEVEKGNGNRGGGKRISPDLQAKMRQLRESLERKSPLNA